MISKSIVFTLLLITVVPIEVFADSATQTDWSGGPGLWGPVTLWGNEFYLDNDIQWSIIPGSVMLSTYVQTNIIDENIDGAVSAYPADIDGDGDIDVAGAARSADQILWWENTNETGTSWTKQVIENNFNNASFVFAEDIDGDGDFDLVGTAYDDNEISWWENDDGLGTSWTKHIVNTDFQGAYCLDVKDINGDGFLDIVVSALSFHVCVCWWENTDGTGTSWIEHIVAEDYGWVKTLHSQDIDGDGDLDILAGLFHENQIAWWENTNGSGASWNKHVIAANYYQPLTVYSDDIDGDGDMDAIASFGTGVNDTLSWWENSDTTPGLFITERIIDDYFRHPQHILSYDIDNDGDIDVIEGAQSSSWLENTDGSGSTWLKHNCGYNSDGNSVAPADINGNGEVDIVLASENHNHVIWYDIEAYCPNSSLESSILNTGTEPSWNILNWDADTPSGTSVAFQVRASDNYTNMGDWSAILNEPGSLIGILSDGDMYVQYRAILTTTDPDTTPLLNEFYLSWNPLGVEDSPEITDYFLHGAVPNPASGLVNISIDVPVLSFVEISIYNISGHLVISPFMEEYNPGEHDLQIDELATGIYFCRMSAENFTDTKSFAVID